MTSIETVVAGQSEAEALMLDVCDITTPSGPAVLDPDTLALVPATPVLLYEALPCWVTGTPGGGPQVGNTEAGERLMYEQGRTIKVPVSTTQVKVGDTVQIVSSTDPDLAGNTFLVRGIEWKTYSTCRRLTCEEVTG